VLGIGFLAAIGKDGSKIGSCASRWKLGWMDELACAGSSDHGASNVAVSKPTNFIDIGLEVVLGIRTLDYMAVFQRFAGGRIDNRIDEMATVWVAGAVEYGVVDCGLSPGGIVLCFVSGLWLRVRGVLVVLGGW
jgi:hypothetical protein